MSFNKMKNINNPTTGNGHLFADSSFSDKNTLKCVINIICCRDRKKHAKKLFALLLFFFLGGSIVVLFRLRNTPPAAVENLIDNVSMPKMNPPVTGKVILFWTDFFGSKDFDLGSDPLARCSADVCQTTNDRNLLSRSDAVVFHIRNLNLQDLPTQRWPHQRWIFFSHESPEYTPIPLRGLKDFFNWTMTYRTDSDVYTPYGMVGESADISHYLRGLMAKHLGDLRPVSSVANRTESWNQLVSRKKKRVAWFSSNCKTPSHREDYVAEMKKFIPVDVYGACGDFQCGDPLSRPPECYEILQRDYKFYLAFENSLCTDYITEKFFNALKHNVVPVVYGGADYAKLAPKNSYIDAQQFQSARRLAYYLNFLDQHDEEYLRFFEWRRTSPNVSALIDWPSKFFQPFCSLCRMIQDPSLPPKSYVDIHSWWHELGKCG